jgi:hypothetical protein
LGYRTSERRAAMKAAVVTIILGSTAAIAGRGSSPSAPYLPCSEDPTKHQQRADELQRIVAADQDDRAGNVMKPGAQFRDRERRERVGAIFGEGCFKEARDFAAAALVFQHGDQPDHFMQTFLWSKRAVELGDQSQQDLMAKGIDRYLVNIGHKQLFATQYFKPSLNPETCWCLDKTEASFPDELRRKHTGKTYQQMLEHLRQLNAGQNCPLAECSRALAPSPSGTVPGFW